MRDGDECGGESEDESCVGCIGWFRRVVLYLWVDELVWDV